MFDFFRVLRKRFKTTDIVTYMQDILFWILTGISMLYCIYTFNSGEIRLYEFIGILIGTNLVIITILNQIFKFILQRPRPTEFRIIDETGYSFPSGHSMISMAFYGFLIYLIYKNIKNKSLKIVLISLLSLLIIMIGISRIYLGVHYTSDVCAGFLVSISYLIIYINCANKIIFAEEKTTEIKK